MTSQLGTLSTLENGLTHTLHHSLPIKVSAGRVVCLKRVIQRLLLLRNKDRHWNQGLECASFNAAAFSDACFVGELLVEQVFSNKICNIMKTCG